MKSRKVLVYVALLTAIALLGLSPSQPSPTAFAQSSCPNSAYCVFIPAVFQRPSGPQLIYPAANEALTIIAPVLKWATPVIGRYRVQVSEDPTFNPSVIPLDLDTTLRVRDPNQQEATRIVNSNVDARKTYYWRVGLEEPLDSGNYNFSPVQSFTTPQRKDSAQLPPIPTLRSPGNNASLRFTTTDITVSWNPVPGATYYRINLELADATGTRVDSELVPASQTSVTFPGVGKRGTNYTWEVKAANSYGWSEFSAPFRFRIQSN